MRSMELRAGLIVYISSLRLSPIIETPIFYRNSVPYNYQNTGKRSEMMSRRLSKGVREVGMKKTNRPE